MSGIGSTAAGSAGISCLVFSRKPLNDPTITAEHAELAEIFERLILRLSAVNRIHDVRLLRTALMPLINERTGEVIADMVEVARTRRERRRGLLGRDGMPRGSALVLTPCNAIHTVGMRFPIDVAFVDRGGRVRRIVRQLPPTRISLCLGAKTTIECPSGQLEEIRLQVGDQISWCRKDSREVTIIAIYELRSTIHWEVLGP